MGRSASLGIDHPVNMNNFYIIYIIDSLYLYIIFEIKIASEKCV